VVATRGLVRDALRPLLGRELAPAPTLLDHELAEVRGRHRGRIEGRAGVRARGVTLRADAREGAVPVERRAGVRDGEQDVRAEAALLRFPGWAPLVGDLDPA